MQIDLRPIADYDPVEFVAGFGHCTVIVQDTDYVLWACGDEFGVELTPTAVSLIVPEPGAISPTTVTRFASVLAEAIGLSDAAPAIATAIDELTADQLAAPGSATAIEIAPGWSIAISAMSDGATIFTADGSATAK